MPVDETIFCKCGCGNTRLKYDKRRRIREYVNGHGTFGKNNGMYGKQSPNLGKKASVEKLLKQSISAKRFYDNGGTHGFKGKKHTIESRKKISESIARFVKSGGIHAMKGKKHNKEAKEKMSNSHIGKKLSDETKQKIYNTTRTDEYRNNAKIRRSNQKYNFTSFPERMIQSLLSINGIEYQKHKPFKIGKTYHQVDIFIEPNTVIEVEGCYFHWCKECMRNKNATHKNIIKTINRDIQIGLELPKQGIKLIRIWEHEIKNNIMKCLDKIKGETS